MKERQLIVLLADEASEYRAALHDAISRDPARYEVIEAESGAHALELCRARARKPDCLILDHDLPGLSGSDALKKLVAEAGSPSCAVVILVDTYDSQIVEEAMKSGAHACIEKNRARGEELLHAVSRAIEKFERQRLGAASELAASRSEDIARERDAEAWQVARAGADSRRGSVSRPDSVFHDQAEEQLRLLKTAIEQSNESVIITTVEPDPPGPRIVYVNPAFTKMTGYPPEDVIGKTPRILQGPKTDPIAFGRLREECAVGRVFHGEIIIYRKDHSELYVEWTAGPVRNARGEVTHLAATQRDVTERRRIEEMLRRCEEEFHSLFELSAIGIAQVSPEGRYLRVNRKFSQLLGYSEQELLQLTLQDVTHPEDIELRDTKLGFTFADRSKEYGFEKRYVRKDGEIIWVLVNWGIMPDAEGRPSRTITSVQDITARKQIEEALRASEAQLRAIFDHSVALIFVKDLDGRYLRVNRKYAELFGVADVELTGKTDYDCHSTEIADVFMANDREVIAANRPILFEEQSHVDGEIRYSVVSKFPLRDESGRPTQSVVSPPTSLSVNAQRRSCARARRLTMPSSTRLRPISPCSTRMETSLQSTAPGNDSRVKTAGTPSLIVWASITWSSAIALSSRTMVR